jgi:hypothetical protein
MPWDPTTAALVTGLGGAIIGAGATTGAAWASSRTARQQLAAGRAEDARALASRGFTDAVVAARWFHADHLEDSAPGALMGDELAPNLERLRAAMQQLYTASAEAGASELGRASLAVAGHLDAIEEAWQRGHSWIRIVEGAKSEKSKKDFGTHVSRAYDDVERARCVLFGVEPGELASREDRTTLSGLLERLRLAVGST